LGGSYCNIGNLTRDSSEAADSLKWYGKAIGILTPVHRREPRDVLASKYLRNSYKGRATAYEQLGKYADAIADVDKAIEVSPPEDKPSLRARRATSRLRAGQVAEAVAEVEDLTNHSDWNAVQWYNFARVYAVASSKIPDKKQPYADRAAELLQKAVKAGFKNAGDVKKNTDLDPLRDRDDFKKLLADLEKPAEKE
jgi:tetratricopeptide (TPR) repeat protein